MGKLNMDWDGMADRLEALEGEDLEREVSKVIEEIFEENERVNDFKGTKVNEENMAKFNTANVLARMIFSDPKYKITIEKPDPKFSTACGMIESFQDDLEMSGFSLNTPQERLLFSKFINLVDGLGVVTEIVNGKLETTIGYDVYNVYEK